MKTIDDERVVHKLIDVSADVWTHIEFKDLKIGDTFRMFEPDGLPVIDMLGFTIFEATSDPYMNEDDEWQIDTE